MQRFLYIVIALILTSCGLECIDSKTGIPKYSQTLKDSKENKVFKFEMIGDKNEILLDNGKILKIRNAWVENSWHYDCVNNKAVLKNDSTFQFLIDAGDNKAFINTDYILMNNDTTIGAYLGSILRFEYSGEDTLSLILVKKSFSVRKMKVIAELKFIKKLIKQ
jgi:hypothetical protein